jgi:hypothetical protein
MRPTTLDANFDNSPIPRGTEREDTGTYRPTIDHNSSGIHEKYLEPAGCQNFAPCLVVVGGDYIRIGRCRSEREPGVGRAIRSPTNP